VLVQNGSGGFGVSVNCVFPGDGTGGANPQGEITAFRFIQNVVTPTREATWSRVKGPCR
jgi:hypothetical protein